jgi:hypothetical protein
LTAHFEPLVICDIGQVAYRGPWTKTILPKTTLLTQTSTEVHWIFWVAGPSVLVVSHTHSFYATHTDAYAILIRMRMRYSCVVYTYI